MNILGIYFGFFFWQNNNKKIGGSIIFLYIKIVIQIVFIFLSWGPENE